MQNYAKYLKYKTKYLQLKTQRGGADDDVALAIKNTGEEITKDQYNNIYKENEFIKKMYESNGNMYKKKQWGMMIDNKFYSAGPEMLKKINELLTRHAQIGIAMHNKTVIPEFDKPIDVNVGGKYRRLTLKITNDDIKIKQQKLETNGSLSDTTNSANTREFILKSSIPEIPKSENMKKINDYFETHKGAQKKWFKTGYGPYKSYEEITDENVLQVLYKMLTEPYITGAEYDLVKNIMGGLVMDAFKNYTRYDYTTGKTETHYYYVKPEHSQHHLQLGEIGYWRE